MYNVPLERLCWNFPYNLTYFKVVFISFNLHFLLTFVVVVVCIVVESTSYFSTVLIQLLSFLYLELGKISLNWKWPNIKTERLLYTLIFIFQTKILNYYSNTNENKNLQWTLTVAVFHNEAGMTSWGAPFSSRGTLFQLSITSFCRSRSPQARSLF